MIGLKPNEISVVIQEGAHLEGRLHFEGTGRIDGVFKGEIYTPDILIIGSSAKIEATVEADVVIVAGHFSGTIIAIQRVELHPPALVDGVIRTNIIQVEEGAVFHGKTEMLSKSISQVSDQSVVSIL